MSRSKTTDLERRNYTDFPSTDWTAIERLALINVLVNVRMSHSKKERGGLDHLDRFIEMLSRADSAVLELNRLQLMEHVPDSEKRFLHVKAKHTHALFGAASPS